MDNTIEQYAAGAGLVFGVGIGGVVGTLAGFDASLALVAAFGAAGGLVAGALDGQVMATGSRESIRAMTTIAFTLGVSLVIGILLGLAGAWMIDGDFLTGAIVGAAGGLVHGVLMTATLRRAGPTKGSSDALGLDR